ncbi:MAG: T9SS type A sorting domain-containing protein [Bacteroidota bacterium]
MSTQGRTMINTIIEEEDNSIDISSLPPGLYVVRVTDGRSKVHVKKIIKN